MGEEEQTRCCLLARAPRRGLVGRLSGAESGAQTSLLPSSLPSSSAPAGGLPGEQALDLLPSAGLVTSSEDYYPTVAINALMRVLREPSAASLHGKAVAALFDIIKAMGLAFVPYLPKVRCCAVWGAVGVGNVWLCRGGCPPVCLVTGCGSHPAAQRTTAQPPMHALAPLPLARPPARPCRWCLCCCS